MKYILHSFIISLLLPSCDLRAMENELDRMAQELDSLVSKFEAQDAARKTASHKEDTTTNNPIFDILFQLLPAATANPSSVQPNTNAAPAPANNTNASDSKKRGNLFLSPPGSKRTAFDLTADDNVPLPVYAPPPLQPKTLPIHIVKAVKTITATLEQETLRKFTYDMQTMQTLDYPAYFVTMYCLKLLRTKDQKFLSTLGITNGTPSIIRYIEEKTKYRFPENIVVRTKQYPYARSLADVAFCTEHRVSEQKLACIDITAPQKSDADIIKKELLSCSPAHLIQCAVNTYLDQSDATENETPEEREKRVYSKAFKLLYSSKHQ
jgi:hypothetical protein